MTLLDALFKSIKLKVYFVYSYPLLTRMVQHERLVFTTLTSSFDAFFALHLIGARADGLGSVLSVIFLAPGGARERPFI